MSILSIFILVIFILTCILLILMVIIQDSDSDSLGGIFAGGSGSAFGSRSSSVVTKFTTVLGVLFFVCAFSLALINKTSLGNVESAAGQDGAASGETWVDQLDSGEASSNLDAAPAQDAAPASGG